MILEKQDEEAKEIVKGFSKFETQRLFDSERDFIELKEIAENDSWFSDNPDVFEVDELIQKWSYDNVN